MGWLRNQVLAVLERIERLFDAIFTPALNPFHYLGALTIFFLWVVLVSGIYLFVFFDTSVFGAYQSVERLTREQWYLGGVMRSLHRYASDAAVLTLLLHMLREFLKDRYRGARWFSWFTGVPLLWLLFPLGITGYWLVWDQLAQYLAIASSELLDWLPIFTDPMARNFLTAESLSDRFFTLMAFLHLLGLPVFLVFMIWFHLLRISQPSVNPPRALALGSLLTLTVLSFISPALSQGQADLAVVPTNLGFDWFYLPVYPLLDFGSAGLVWGLLFGTSLLISVMPWLPPLRREPVAVVDLNNCNGCGRCAADCPFGAVIMGPRTDRLQFPQQAVVDPALCTSCGLCAGACPTSTPYRRRSELVPGIDLPGLPISALREETLAATQRLSGAARVLVYACRTGPLPAELRGPGVGAVAVPCIGMLPPSFLDFVITRGHADGVFLLGCAQGDCHYRRGDRWTEERLAGQRDPYLRKRVPLERIERYWGGGAPAKDVRQALDTFRTRLAGLGPLAARPGVPAETKPHD